ncbi:MAG TPA: tetratricopeptide repeat protein [Burkholderiales bacterium]|nr:tetratricopeptide repeat protein [Burkholderiales bacterium]
MSLINKMLQELDRRHAVASPNADVMTQQIEPVAAGRRRRDLFWLILGLELAVALGWLAWTSYQLRPQSVVTELALRTAGGVSGTVQPVRPPAPTPAQRPAPPPAPTPVPAPAASIAPAQISPPAPQPANDTLKLAQSIERAIPPPRPRTVPNSIERRHVPKPPPSEPVEDAQPQVEKRPHPSTPAQDAQAEFRRAVQLLNQGRVSEAEQALTEALATDPSQAPARQALVSLLIDQRRLNEAQRLLQEGLTLDPAQVQFATVLARIYVERADYGSALGVLRSCKGDVSRDAEYNTLLGAVLQHMSRPREAADAYRAALRAAPQAGTAWIGLGLSLAAQDHRPEAAEAFRRAVATGSLSQEVKDYAEQQLRRLQ